MESYWLEVIEACWKGSASSNIVMVVDDVLKMKRWFSQCALLWTPREANQVAHHVARLLLARNLKGDWVIINPPSVVQHLHIDSQN